MSNKTKQPATKLFNVDDLQKIDALYFSTTSAKASENTKTFSIPKGKTKTELSFMKGFR